MNAAVNTLYAEYLEHTGGDKAAAASLALAAVLRDSYSKPSEPPKPEPADGRPLTVPEVAKHLRVSPDKVLGWIRSGALRAYNVTAKKTADPNTGSAVKTWKPSCCKTPRSVGLRHGGGLWGGGSVGFRQCQRRGCRLCEQPAVDVVRHPAEAIIAHCHPVINPQHI